MMEFYSGIKSVHVLCVILSGTLFALRGVLGLKGSPYANHVLVRYLSYVIDTSLLTAALMLVTLLHQYPFVQAWLTVKILLVVVYIILGSFALKQGRARRTRLASYVAALAVYLFIVSIAHTHNPWGILSAFAA